MNEKSSLSPFPLLKINIQKGICYNIFCVKTEQREEHYAYTLHFE